MTCCKVQLLGSFSIILNDLELVHLIPGEKAKLLLAYLVLSSDMPQNRKKIAFDFWPDSTDKQALSNLRKLLHDLRKRVPQMKPYLKITSTYIQWNYDYPLYLDVHKFEEYANGLTLDKLHEAEALYKGDLLPGFYEEWVNEKREQLAHTYSDVLKSLISKLEKRREYTLAIYFANKLLLQNTLKEETYRNLMRLHALNLGTADVVRVYEKLCSVLQTELGIEPAEETSRLFRRLTVSGGEKDIEKHTSTPFIGRSAEWQNILEIWNQVVEDRNTLVLITGEAGIGKTKLAKEFQSWVNRQGWPVAFASCYSSVASMSYAPVKTWLRSFPLPQMSSVWLAELARLLPEIIEQHPYLPDPAPIQGNLQLQKWYEAIELMLPDTEPLLLLLDNIQWCDEETINLLSYLLRTDPKVRIMVIATMRTDEFIDHAIGRFISTLRSERKLMEMKLTPFTEEETKQLMTATAGENLSELHSASIHAETGGIPLFIVESLKEWQIGSEKITDRASLLMKSVIEPRINRLSAEKRGLVFTIAAIGRSVSTSFLSLIHGMDEDRIINKIEQLLQLNIIREHHDGQYYFTHDIVREIAYKLTSDSARNRIHGQIAQGMITFYQSQSESYAAEIAFHYEQAGMIKESVQYYISAALGAEKIYANAAKIKFYQKLLQSVASRSNLDLHVEAWRNVDYYGGLGRGGENVQTMVETIWAIRYNSRSIILRCCDWQLLTP